MCYFSSKTIIAFSLLILCPALVQAQTNSRASATSPAGSEDITVASPSSNEQPAKIQLLPPELPERRQPTLMAVPVSRSSSFVQTKVSLAWRQKAQKLAMNKFASSQDNAYNPLLRSFAGNYSDTLMALAGSCAAGNFKVDFINSNAGELLATSTDGASRLIFCIWEQPQGKTWIAAGIDRGGTASGTKNATFILDTTSSTIAKRGRI